MILLDTTVVSRIMQRQPAVIGRLKRLLPGELVISSPVAAEIQFGLHRLVEGSRRRLLLEAEYRRLRSLVRWSDWTESASTEFGRQKALLARSGRSLQDMDVAIGSLAIALGAELATCYAKHMSRLRGIVLQDWDS